MALGAPLLCAWWVLAPAQVPLPPPAASAPAQVDQTQATDNGDLVVQPEALRVDTLLRRETRARTWAVAVLASPDVPYAAQRRGALQAALLDVLRDHKRVKRVRAYEDVADLVALPDAEAAQEVALDAAVSRVLLARLSAGPDGNPRVRLMVADKQGAVVRMLELRDVFGASAPASGTGGGWRAKAGLRREFEAQALEARRGPVGPNGLPVVVVMRGSHVLDQAELEALGMVSNDELDPPDAGAPIWTRVALVAISPLVLLLPTLGLAVCGLGCAGVGATVSSGDPSAMAPTATICGLFGGCLGTGLGAVAGGVVSGVAAAIAYVLAGRVEGSDVVHPAVAGVNRHNRALAKRLGLAPRGLPKRYFPAAR